jgi:hypothetical protein
MFTTTPPVVERPCYRLRRYDEKVPARDARLRIFVPAETLDELIRGIGFIRVAMENRDESIGAGLAFPPGDRRRWPTDEVEELVCDLIMAGKFKIPEVVAVLWHKTRPTTRKVAVWPYADGYQFTVGLDNQGDIVHAWISYDELLELAASLKVAA